MVEVRGRISFNNNRYSVLDRGWDQIQRLTDISGYVGPTPVSLAAYSAMVRSQSKPDDVIGPEDIKAAFHDLVLPMQKQIAILGNQNTQLRQIRDRLLPRLISGKLQVKTDSKTKKSVMA